MSTMAFQITGALIVCSTVCSGAHQRKYQSSASLVFVRGIQRWSVDSPHKGPILRKCFHLMTSSCGRILVKSFISTPLVYLLNAMVSFLRTNSVIMRHGTRCQVYLYMMCLHTSEVNRWRYGNDTGDTWIATLFLKIKAAIWNADIWATKTYGMIGRQRNSKKDISNFTRDRFDHHCVRRCPSTWRQSAGDIYKDTHVFNAICVVVGYFELSFWTELRHSKWLTISALRIKYLRLL